MAKSNTISKSDQALNNVLRQIRNINAAEARGEEVVFTQLKNNKPAQAKKDSIKDSGLTSKIAQGYKRTRKPSPRKIENNLIQLSIETGVPVEVLRINPNLRPKG